MFSWQIITGEYPPEVGGVGDYTRMLASGLAAAGDEVDVWGPSCSEPALVDAGVRVHRLPDHFGLRSIAALNTALSRCSQPSRVLVQYVPHAFGWKALNIPFCLWLFSQRRRSLWIMFHEVAFPIRLRQSLSRNVLGLGNRIMAELLARAAERVFVSIPKWTELLPRATAKGSPITWLPIPSNIPVANDSVAVAEVRARYTQGRGLLVGHFGTYGEQIKQALMATLPPLLSSREDVSVLLIGRKSAAVSKTIKSNVPGLAGRIHSTGGLSAAEVSYHISACDLMVQPYPDGVSSRRGSIMAGLSHGVPCVTTSGSLTEPLWSDSRAVALAPAGDISALLKAIERLVTDVDERLRMSQAGRELYGEYFDIKHTLAGLRRTSCPDPRDEAIGQVRLLAKGMGR